MYVTCRTVSWNVIILNNINDNIVNSKQYTMLDLRFLEIALGHDTYREQPYRYCIDISPYRLIPSGWWMI